MKSVRRVKKIVKARKTMEGAGVILNRAIGFDDPYQYDPFLLFDDFRSDNPEDFMKGFPWHPHRGIETITYVLKGQVEHEDSLGNKGIIGEGDIQWMTAGSGIYHQEMPLPDPSGKMYGFQLWANLPQKDKMMPPKYRDITAEDIPVVKQDNGVSIKIIAGTLEGIRGPVSDVTISPEYFDITIPPGTDYIRNTVKGHRLLLYVFEGSGYIETPENGSVNQVKIENRNMIIFEDGEQMKITTRDGEARLLLFSGKPINEPIAWYGPIVMNTDEELRIAYDELQKGTFIKAHTA
ncbi:MAG: pirin family protein [Spirochaetales bacterium]|nr:pirin family protein [Spirochaetales bacterium]